MIDDGLGLSDKIEQRVGVLQGDRLSPTLFLIYVADLLPFLQTHAPDTDCTMYADDLQVMATRVESVQNALNALESWCSENSIHVNLSKTRVVKYRRGGRLAASDKLTYKGEAVEFASEY